MSLSAQEPAEPAKAKANKRTIRAVFIEAPRKAPEIVVLQEVKKEGLAGEVIDVKLPRRNLSAKVNLPKGSLTVAILTNAVGEGEKLPSEAQKITIPENWTNCIIILFPDRKNQIFPGRAVIVDSSNASFPKGDTMIYNLSNVLFRGNFGNKKVIINPRKSGLLKAPRKVKVAYPVLLDCLLPQNKERRVITRTKWVHNPDARQIVFVTPVEGRDLPKVWSVLDHT